MRFFATAALLVAGVTARMNDDVDDCVNGVIDSINASDLTSLCTDSDAMAGLSKAISSKCGDAANTQAVQNSCESRMGAPARHLSHPMERVTDKRAYAPSMPGMPAAPPSEGRQVVYLTKTEYACNAMSTPVMDPMHVSQIPVNVPAPASSSSMMMGPNSMGMTHATPVYSNGVLVAATSSAVYGSQMGAATPNPSGASAFSPFQGAAPQVSAAKSGAAAVAVAAVMGLMVAL